jgi:hypothetical protein
MILVARCSKEPPNAWAARKLLISWIRENEIVSLQIQVILERKD